MERVDHGIRSLEDPALVARLRDGAGAADRLPAVERGAARASTGPEPTTRCAAMLDAGLLATVNSDDPAYFGGYLHDNVDRRDARARA